MGQKLEPPCYTLDERYTFPIHISLANVHIGRAILYSQKIWRGIKFGGLAVLGETAKLKSAKIYNACMYVW